MRLIDADVAKKLYKEQCMGDCGCCSDLQDDNTCILIDQASTVADAVIVTRCESCKHSYTKNRPCDTLLFRWCRKWNNIVRDCDFCSYGERREGGAK